MTNETESGSKSGQDVKADLVLLEKNIMLLKVEYEQYFMRILDREPLDLKKKVDRTIAHYTHTHITNTANKFHFRNLADKYNTFRQYWIRTLKAIENGTYRRKSESSDGIISGTAKAGKSGKSDIKVENWTSEGEFMEIYNNYIAEMKKINEPTDNITYDFLKKAVMAQKKMAEEKYGITEVNFKIMSTDGKVKIQMVPKN